MEKVPDTTIKQDWQIQMSIAISLKRIADALLGTENTTGIVAILTELLNNIELNGRNNG